MKTVPTIPPGGQHPSGLLISALSVEALRDFISRGAAVELLAYVAALLGLGMSPMGDTGRAQDRSATTVALGSSALRSRGTNWSPIDPDDTSRCPLDSGCETCGAVDDLALLTAPVMSGGITCITLCGSCADACDLPTSWSRAECAEKVHAHARHLGIGGRHLGLVVLDPPQVPA